MKLPPQCPPVHRNQPVNQASVKGTGVEAAQTPCDSLDGMARQLCYALAYGVST